MTDLSRSLFEDPMWKGLLVDMETGEPARPKPGVDYAELGKIAARGIFETTVCIA